MDSPVHGWEIPSKGRNLYSKALGRREAVRLRQAAHFVVTGEIGKAAVIDGPENLLRCIGSLWSVVRGLPSVKITKAPGSYARPERPRRRIAMQDLAAH